MSHDQPTLAVGVIAVKDSALLMVKRGREPAKGLWSVPGGKVERGEYLGDALRREVLEETGLEVTVGDLIGFFEVIGSDHHFVIMDFFAESPGDADPIAGDDVDEVRWVPLDDVVSLDCTPRFVETLRAWGVLA